MIGTIRAALVLVVIVPATLVAVAVQLVALRAGFPRPDRMPRAWHRLVLRLLGIRLHLHGRPAQGRPLLLASNHVSWTDIPVLGSLAPMSFVAKADMRDWPVFGFLATLQQSIFIERDRARTSAVQARELGSRLAAGTTLALFAEGTTADGNALAPFKSTLFGAAAAALTEAAAIDHVLVQPVAIAYTRLHGMPMGRLHRRHAAWIGDADLAPHLLGLIREGAMDVEVHFGEPVPFRRGDDRKAIARRMETAVRDLMAQALRDPDVSSQPPVR